MTVTAEQWRAYGQRFVDEGYDYCINCDRCGGSCHCLDCSGMQCKISNGLGITRNLCTTSFVMASQCWDLGLYMTADQAERNDGPDVFWAFKGANFGRTDDGSRPNGASGHIVTVVRVRNKDGSTDGFYTIEAMGHAYGCDNGSYWGRNWSGRYRIPGVATGPPPPPPAPPRRRTMAVQQPRRAGNPAGRVACVRLSKDLMAVDCLDGASIKGDSGNSDPRTLGRWVPPTIKGPFTDLGKYDRRDPNTGEIVDEVGVFVVNAAGETAIGEWS